MNWNDVSDDVRDLAEGDRPFQYDLPLLRLHERFTQFCCSTEHNCGDPQTSNRFNDLRGQLLASQFKDD